MGKETDESLGCLLFIVAAALAIFLLYHGAELAQRVLGAC